MAIRILDMRALRHKLHAYDRRLGNGESLTDEESEDREELATIDVAIDFDKVGDTEAFCCADKVEYAQGWAEQIGVKVTGWPYDGNIDWEGAADDLLADFTIFEYQGQDWAMRE